MHRTNCDFNEDLLWNRSKQILQIKCLCAPAPRTIVVAGVREFHSAMSFIWILKGSDSWIWRLNCPHTQFTASKIAGCGTCNKQSYFLASQKLLILIWRCCWQAKELIIQVHVVCFLADRKAEGCTRSAARAAQQRADGGTAWQF
jgi:hypothetical protein